MKLPDTQSACIGLRLQSHYNPLHDTHMCVHVILLRSAWVRFHWRGSPHAAPRYMDKEKDESWGAKHTYMAQSD
jgi:hypothetical protein